MLYALIGNFDFSSALALLILIGCPSLIFIVYLSRKPVKTELMKAQTEREVAMLNAANSHVLNIKKLDQNLITSHKSNDT